VATASPGPDPSAASPSLAVLPFVDLSEKRDHEYFSDGLAEELLNLLAQLPQLRVIARTSSFAFRGKDADLATIAHALNVTTVLEGSVRKSGNMLRITAQLIRTADSSHLWSQTYDRELTDVFKVQDEIAGAVVAALKVKLWPNQHVTNINRTTSAEAHEQYLLGQEFIRRGRLEDFEHAVALFRRAAELDPHYAAAHAGVAMALSAAGDFTADPVLRLRWKNEALATAEKTIAMAPDLADGYVDGRGAYDGAARDRRRSSVVGGLGRMRRRSSPHRSYSRGTRRSRARGRAQPGFERCALLSRYLRARRGADRIRHRPFPPRRRGIQPGGHRDG
jgi:TolB-like protein